MRPARLAAEGKAGIINTTSASYLSKLQYVKYQKKVPVAGNTFIQILDPTVQVVRETQKKASRILSCS